MIAEFYGCLLYAGPTVLVGLIASDVADRRFHRADAAAHTPRPTVRPRKTGASS